MVELPIEQTMSDDIEARTVYPDVIVHHRTLTGDEHNMLVIEAKKSGKEKDHVGKPSDRAKLEAYTREPLGYEWGIYIVFNVQPSMPRFPLADVQCYREGRKADRETGIMRDSLRAYLPSGEMERGRDRDGIQNM